MEFMLKSSRFLKFNQEKPIFHLIVLAIFVITMSIFISDSIALNSHYPLSNMSNSDSKLDTKISEIPPDLESEPTAAVSATPTQKPNLIPTPIPTKQIPTQDLPVKGTREYGISTGGGLISLSQEDLNQYFESLKLLGAQWVRFDIEWGQIQLNNTDSFNWGNTDRVVLEAKKYNINILGTIAYAPKWARDPSCSNDFGCEPNDPKIFGHFSGVAASHYKDSITYWEIWNEPNSANFLGPRSDVTKYIDILKAAYIEIKNANPRSFVISGGLEASVDGVDSGISPLTFIKTLYASGANQYFDAVALHPYTYPVSPNYVAEWNSWQQMSSIHQLMVSKGDSGKKIWITEYGAPTGGPGNNCELDQLSFTYGSDYMSESAQKEMVQQATLYYNQNTSWMGPFFWYSLHDNGTSRDTPENFFGLTRNDWSKKPSFVEFQEMISGQ